MHFINFVEFFRWFSDKKNYQTKKYVTICRKKVAEILSIMHHQFVFIFKSLLANFPFCLELWKNQKGWIRTRSVHFQLKAAFSSHHGHFPTLFAALFLFTAFSESEYKYFSAADSDSRCLMAFDAVISTLYARSEKMRWKSLASTHSRLPRFG